jgi:hypothetical protein
VQSLGFEFLSVLWSTRVVSGKHVIARFWVVCGRCPTFRSHKSLGSGTIFSQLVRLLTHTFHIGDDPKFE